MSRLKLKAPLITETNPKSPISEAYKILRTNIEFSNLEENIRVIMVTSTKMNEGKSTTSANMAVTYAQSSKRVLLIDADMRKPTQHHIFNVSNREGLTSVLSNQKDLNDVIVSTSVPNLNMIPAGPVPPNPSEMLASARMDILLKKTKEFYDIIVIDTPPIMLVTDAQIVAAKSDGVVLVIDSGNVKKDAALKAKANLEHVKARVLGVVLNNINRKNAEGYYYYYGSNKL
ncbi:CpsD/CapB family tyrosine-protein kinase [Paenibacillus sp. GCM10012307]|uniref:non-specific protein-tyrosine kinase n=1 Tax=Paenibacillus roseus TaxID=2798579 RepID=A0A934J3T2_9BACL|nr:CpsD/CapB family tyrosine-protein kinase [Paenibacillus roseus]MBJ6359782.1 CpsD/CapB family tyrosine-protein kinase [Paenibacillus roseus]